MTTEPTTPRLTRVEIDLNVRSHGAHALVGFEDADGPLQPGQQVEVHERESGLTGTGTVTQINPTTRLAWIAIEWTQLRTPDGTETGATIATEQVGDVVAGDTPEDSEPAPGDGRDDTIRERYASCPGYETTPNPCRCPCYGCKHHCSAHRPLEDGADDAGNLERAAEGSSKPAADLNEGMREAIRAAIHDADDHSCQYGEGVPYDAMATAVLAVRDRDMERLRADKAALQRAVRNLMRTERAETRRADAAEAQIAAALAVAEVIDANGISWAADSIRRALTGKEHTPPATTLPDASPR